MRLSKRLVAKNVKQTQTLTKLKVQKRLLRSYQLGKMESQVMGLIEMLN
jgi:hypothetical protein